MEQRDWFVPMREQHKTFHAQADRTLAGAKGNDPGRQVSAPGREKLDLTQTESQNAKSLGHPNPRGGLVGGLFKG
jgi:hypothetical protein